MKKLFAFLLSVLLLCGIVTPALAADDAPAGYTPIRTAEDLNNIRNNLSGKYILMNDIDLSGFGEWTPIGSAQTPFCGTLIGNRHVVRSMKINSADAVAAPRIGLFAVIDGAEVAGIRMEAISISVYDPSYTSIAVGGIAGILLNSRIANCITSGKITVTGGRGLFVGGIGGWSSAFLPKESGAVAVSDCSNRCEISVTGRCDEPPVISYGDEYLFNHTQVGGILGGHKEAKLLRCSNDGTLSVQPLYDAFVGGIAGAASVAQDCCSVGDIEVKAMPGEAPCCVGGIAGQAKDLQSCVQTAALSAVNGIPCGALLGKAADWEKPILKDCYYLNHYAPIGENPNEVKTKATARSEKELTQRQKLRGLDFDTVWMIENDRPRLIAPSDLPEAVTVSVGASATLPAAIVEGTAADERIATVSADGTVAGISQGETEAPLISINGEYKTVRITVEPAKKRSLWLLLILWITGLFEKFKNLF